MRQVFISYARDDWERVEALAERLRRLVDSVWFDSQLHGGEDWWAGILERIRSCDVFLAVVSRASLESQACRIEREYARRIGRTTLPVALEDVPQALPTDLATVQIVDFTTPGEQALAELARALLAAPASVPLPDPLPEDPEPPLSYLTSLVDLVTSPSELTKSEQVEIVSQLERGLRAPDPDERDGARQVLHRMAARDDLASSVEQTIRMLEKDQTPAPPSAPALTHAPREPAPTAPAAAGDEATRQEPPAAQASWPVDVIAAPGVDATATWAVEPDNHRRRWLVAVGVLAALAVIVAGVWAVVGRDSDPPLIEAEATATSSPTPSPTGGNGTPTTPPPDCSNPPSTFPGRVAHGTTSTEALEWQKLLVSKGVFNNSPENCDGAYNGPEQKDKVIEYREGYGLAAADGLLDRGFYDCLVHGCDGECTPVKVPNVVGKPSSEAQAILGQSGFEVAVKEEASEIDTPGTVIRQDREEACQGATVTITVAVSAPPSTSPPISPPTPTPTPPPAP